MSHRMMSWNTLQGHKRWGALTESGSPRTKVILHHLWLRKETLLSLQYTYASPTWVGLHAHTLGRAKLGLLANNNYQWAEKRVFAAVLYSKEKSLQVFLASKHVQGRCYNIQQLVLCIWVHFTHQCPPLLFSLLFLMESSALSTK